MASHELVEHLRHLFPRAVARLQQPVLEHRDGGPFRGVQRLAAGAWTAAGIFRRARHVDELQRAKERDHILAFHRIHSRADRVASDGAQCGATVVHLRRRHGGRRLWNAYLVPRGLWTVANPTSPPARANPANVPSAMTSAITVMAPRGLHLISSPPHQQRRHPTYSSTPYRSEQDTSRGASSMKLLFRAPSGARPALACGR